MRPDFPTGTVTLVFTDIEGSTKLLHELGAEAYAEALAEHRRLLREVFVGHGGVEVDTQGDAFFYAFADASEAVVAADEGREALRPGRIHVRLGIHTGAPHLGPEGYVGHDVHLGARIGAAGHGGQVLLSEATRVWAGVGDDSLLDLGEHRLKDFEEPIRILQLGAERFPPLKTISNTNLPRPASSFIGREREVQDVVALMRGDGARFVSLTGPGGSGKTRLAIEAAAELIGDHRAGTFWVELAPIRDSALVTDEIAKTLGAQDGLAEHIGEREMLLVLDNLEQVIEAAPALASLVEACPNLRMLVSSRERLRVRGEVEYPVAPLAEPDAVALFLSRAGHEQADDALHELCRALDAMPLAIELAAARASVLTPAQIFERVSQRLDLFAGGRDADPRQRTLRSTIEWSHDLLGADEQRLFARLAVFVGGCSLDTAEVVVGADLDTLQSLVEKSLLRHTDDRFWMYETIREFALERLEASGEADAVRRRHAEHFLELAEEAEPHLRHEDEAALDRLEAEHDNVRAALKQFEAMGEVELELRLCSGFWWLWSLRGPGPEGRRRLGWVLERELRPIPARAAALTGAADLAVDAGEVDLAKRYCEEALRLHRSFGDEWYAAYTLKVLGVAHGTRQEWREAIARFEDSARVFEALGDENYALQSRQPLAWPYRELGELDRARELQEEVLRSARAIGDRFVEARSQTALGMFALEEGRLDEAVERFTSAHELHRARPNLPDRYWDAILLCRFARALSLQAESAKAATLLSCWEASLEQIGMDVSHANRWLVEMNDETLRAIATSLDEADAAEAREKGRRIGVDEAVALALQTLT